MGNQQPTAEDVKPAQMPDVLTNEKEAVFGGGCFWCTEAAYNRLKGVQKVVSGYANGHTQDPDYE